MNHTASLRLSWLLALSAAALWGGCGGDPASQSSNNGSAAQANSTAGASVGSGAGAPGSSGAGIAGSVSSAGAPSSAGATAAAGSGVAGDSNPGSSGSGAVNAGASGAGAPGAAAGAPGAGAPGAAGSGTGGGVAVDPACKLSTPVSFKKDIEPFLLTSCGNSGRTGCHVTDSSSTVNSKCPDGTMKCGFDHAYDWITAGVHNQYCNQTPAPIRYTVVMAVVKGPKPTTCNASRVMPPSGAPLTACQMNALDAWIAEPKVLQLHRADDTSPAPAYMMPPFN